MSTVGEEVRTTTSEDFGFKKLGQSTILPSYDEKLPFASLQNFDISNAQNKFAASSGGKVVVGELQLLRDHIQNGTEKSMSFLWERDVEDVVMVKIISKEALLLAQRGGSLYSLDLESMGELKKIKDSACQVVQTCLMESTLGQILFILNDQKKLTGYDIGSGESFDLLSSVSSFDIRDSKLYLFMDDYSIEFYDFEHSTRALTLQSEVQTPPELIAEFEDQYYPISINFLDASKVLLVYGEINSETDDSVMYEHKTFIMDISVSTPSFQESFDITPAFGSVLRYPTYYNIELPHVVPDCEVVNILASSCSSEVTIWDSEEVIQPSQDSERAVLPISKETDNDTNPVGVSLDVVTIGAITNPCPGVDSIEELPLIYILNNEGSIQIVGLYHSSAIKNDTFNLKSLKELISNEKTAKSNNDVQTSSTSSQAHDATGLGNLDLNDTENDANKLMSKPVQSDSQSMSNSNEDKASDHAPPGELVSGPEAKKGLNAEFDKSHENKILTSDLNELSLGKSERASTFGKSTFASTENALASGKLSTGQSSSGSTENAFDKPAFGKPAFGKADNSSAFGKPLFGNTDDSLAFGKPSFGSSENTSAFGKPSFGKPSFGNMENALAFGKSSLGSPGNTSAFGKPSFGNTENAPAFGKPSFGNMDDASAFGKPLFGGTDKSSAFGKSSFGSTENAPAFGKPSFGNTENAPAFGKPSFGNKDDTSAFGKPLFGDTDKSSAFGKSSFGSTENTPAFGKPSFGKPSFGNMENAPAFGKPSFGSTENAPAFGKPSFGNTENASAFGKLSLGSNENTSAFGKPSFGSAANAPAIGKSSSGKNEAAPAFGKATFGVAESKSEFSLAGGISESNESSGDRKESVPAFGKPSFGPFDASSPFSKELSNVESASAFGKAFGKSTFASKATVPSFGMLSSEKADSSPSSKDRPLFSGFGNLNSDASKIENPFLSNKPSPFATVTSKGNDIQIGPLKGSKDVAESESPNSQTSSKIDEPEPKELTKQESPEKWRNDTSSSVSPEVAAPSLEQSDVKENVNLAAGEKIEDDDNLSGRIDTLGKENQEEKGEEESGSSRDDNTGDMTTLSDSTVENTPSLSVPSFSSDKNISATDSISSITARIKQNAKFSTTELNSNKFEDSSKKTEKSSSPFSSFANDLRTGPSSGFSFDNIIKAKNEDSDNKSTAAKMNQKASLNTHEKTSNLLISKEPTEEDTLEQPDETENAEKKAVLDSTQRPSGEMSGNLSYSSSTNVDQSSRPQNVVTETALDSVNSPTSGPKPSDDPISDDSDSQDVSSEESYDVLEDITHDELENAIDSDQGIPLQDKNELDTKNISTLLSEPAIKAKPAMIQKSNQTEPIEYCDFEAQTFEEDEPYLALEHSPRPLKKYLTGADVNQITYSSSKPTTRSMEKSYQLVCAELSVLQENISNIGEFMHDQSKHKAQERSSKSLSNVYTWRLSEAQKFNDILAEQKSGMVSVNTIKGVDEVVSDLNKVILPSFSNDVKRLRELVEQFELMGQNPELSGLKYHQARMRLQLRKKMLKVSDELNHIQHSMQLLKLHAVQDEKLEGNLFVEKLSRDLYDREDLLARIDHLCEEIQHLHVRKESTTNQGKELDIPPVNEEIEITAVVEVGLLLNSKKQFGSIFKGKAAGAIVSV